LKLDTGNNAERSTRSFYCFLEIYTVRNAVKKTAVWYVVTNEALQSWTKQKKEKEKT
jgi:hypothetical protein